MVQIASGTDVPDAPSGFRAYSRSAAMSINIVTSFSYVAETIIQAGKKRIAITSVPVVTNPKTRESRLFNSMFEHIRKSTVAIIRSYTMYEPFKIFLATGSAVFAIGTIPWIWFVGLSVLAGEPLGGHLQSLVFGGVFMIMGFLFITVGLVADLLAINRKLIEDALYRLKKMEFDHQKELKDKITKVEVQLPKKLDRKKVPEPATT